MNIRCEAAKTSSVTYARKFPQKKCRLDIYDKLWISLDFVGAFLETFKDKFSVPILETRTSILPAFYILMLNVFI